MDPLKFLFIADGRSPTAANWIGNIIQAGHEVHLASTFPCEPLPGSASYTVVPVALSSLDTGTAGRGALLRRLTTPGQRAFLRQWLGLPGLRRAAARVNQLAHQIRPDLVHALRIPFEGMLAAMAAPFNIRGVDIPLFISVWGNDFTLHATANPMMGRCTRLAMSRAAAVLADSRRDLDLAIQWGLTPAKPTALLPGGGGVDPEIFFPPERRDGPPVIVNARGYRAYVHTEAFFQAVPLVLAQVPEAQFLCTGMVGHSQTTGHLARLEAVGAGTSVRMLPQIPHAEMGDLFRSASIAVSPSSHDGTPNTLLEAMACGCFPVAGDIESVREWIRDGQNGLLVDPHNPEALAEAIIEAIGNSALREQAARENIPRIRKQVTRPAVAEAAQAFYRSVLGKGETG